MAGDAVWYEAAHLTGITNALNAVADALGPAGADGLLPPLSEGSGDAVAGSDPALLDGLDAQDAESLLSAGAPDPTARVVSVTPGRIEAQLPDAFPSGQAVAQMFIVHEGDVILSNPFPLDVGALP